jgi:lysophospholipase L1-like esterase
MITALVFAFSLSIYVQAQTTATNLLVKDGQTVAFMGDSITGMGWGVPGGFVHLVVDGLAANGVKITPIPAGVGGNRSVEMLKRVDADVISKKPDWLLLSCGVNDVWSRSIDLDTFKKNITEIVDRAQAAGIKVMILPPTPIYEASKQEFNDKIPSYVDFMKQLAKEHNLPCADIHQAWLDYIAAHANPDNPNIVTVDGVHPNPDGHIVFAKTILATFGATPDQIATAEKAWREAPQNATVPTNFAFDFKVPVSADELAALNKMAADQKIDLKRLLHTVGLQAGLDQLKTTDLTKTYPWDMCKAFGAEAKQKIDAMTNSPAGAAGAEPQEVSVWFSGGDVMSLDQWDALKKGAEARKMAVMRIAMITLMEVVRDNLATQPDLSKVWSDNITNLVAPAFKAKLDAFASDPAAK